jgi:hypothetical protein
LCHYLDTLSLCWIVDDVSSFHIVLTCFHLRDSRQSLPSETILLPPVVLDPFPLPFIVFLPQSGHLRRSNLNVPVFPNNKSLSLVIHFPTRFKVLYLHCIISILGILGPKLGILYLSPFILSRRRFHLHLSR